MQKTISNKKKFKSNPRQITKKQYDLLKLHLEELGDLSGVIYCRNNKAYVGGNQRSEVFNGAVIEIVEEYKEPTINKTMAHGYIVYNNEKYAYREVAFTEEEFNKACIVANNDGGSWDWDVLANEWDADLLNDWGFEVPGLDMEMDLEQAEASEDNQIIDYNMTIVCSDEIEFAELQQNLKTENNKIHYSFIKEYINGEA